MATPEVRQYGFAMQPILEDYVSVNADLERAANEGSQKRFGASEHLLADCIRHLSDLNVRLKVIRPPAPFQRVHTDLVSALDTYRSGVTAVHAAAQARNADAMNQAVAICQQAVVQINDVVPRLWQIVKEQV